MTQPSGSRSSTSLILATVASAMAAVAIAAGMVLLTGATLGPGSNQARVAPGASIAAGSSPQPHLLLTPNPTFAPSEAAGMPSPSVPVPSPRARPAGPFAMDLYRKGDYVGELTKVWCLPAAMQTSMNIMAAGADTTRATQARIFSIARKLAPAPDGAAEPEGWALGLTKLGYGAYAVTEKGSIAASIHLVARQIRLTNRPAGLLVWRGAHSWVVSGFTATADPALTDSFTVTAVRIEDVWYPRFSTIWGYSRSPDALVPVSALGADYLPWKRPTGRYPGKDGRYVVVIPTT
ncbi:MAG: hypothetical protein ACRDGI_01475 [Candidatus Limnocylindrales bacterium]